MQDEPVGPMNRAKATPESTESASGLTMHEAVFQRVFDDIPIGLILLDQKQTITRVNRAWGAILDYEPDLLVGKVALDLVAGSDPPFEDNVFSYVCGCPVPSNPIDKVFRRRSGESFVGRATVLAILDQRGAPSCRLGVLEDLTDVQRAEEQQRGAREAEHALAVEHARLDGVLLAARLTADRLGNALSLTRGYNELVLEQPDLPPTVRQMIQESTNGLQLAVDFLHDLQQITHVATRDTPVGPMLDLHRSIQRPPESAREKPADPPPR